MSEMGHNTLEDRLSQIAVERDRLEKEQDSLREDAELELRRIDPMIEEIRKEIAEKEREIDGLKSKRATIEDFLQKLNTRSHPLRRSAVA